MRGYGKYSTRGRVETREANTARGKPSAVFALRHPPSAAFFIHSSIGSALTVILYFLVVWLGAIFSSTQTAVIFGDQDISKCLTNLFLAVEQTNRISLANFSDLQYHARDQSCCLSGVVCKKLCDQTIGKCLYNLFLAVEQTRRISLAGFSNLGVLFT